MSDYSNKPKQKQIEQPSKVYPALVKRIARAKVLLDRVEQELAVSLVSTDFDLSQAAWKEHLRKAREELHIEPYLKHGGDADLIEEEPK